MMPVEEIFEAFAVAEAIPTAAIEAARAQREAITPHFLECLEKSAASDEICPQDEPLVLVAHVLAEFQERRAYRPFMRLLRKDPDRLDAALGETLNETLPHVVLSFYDGDLGPIYEVIEAEDADEFVRANLFYVLAALVLLGHLERDVVKRYLVDCYGSLEPQAGSFIWFGWFQAIALLGLTECHDLAHAAFRNGFIQHWVTDWAGVKEDLAKWTDRDDPNAVLEDADLYQFDDCLERLSDWFSGSSEHAVESALDEHLLQIGAYRPSTETYVNPYRNVGRNDTCPCGSGKKFKKCCANAVGELPVDERRALAVT